MIDRHLLPLQHRILRPLARGLRRWGVSADALSVVGFLLGLAALPLLAAHAYGPALLALLLNRLFDGLDGMVARLGQPTRRGAFLDIALDFFLYATVPLGFALADPAANALPAAVLLTGFVGTGSSFLAFAAVAHPEDRSSSAYPGKGIFYLGGLTEGAETIAFFVVVCLWPGWFPALALVFAAACFLTTLARWREGWKRLPGPAGQPPAEPAPPPASGASRSGDSVS